MEPDLRDRDRVLVEVEAVAARVKARDKARAKVRALDEAAAVEAKV